MWSVSDLDCYYVMNEAVKITKEYHKKSESPRKGSHIHTRAHLNAIHYNVDRRDCPEPKKNNEIKRKVHTHTHTRVTIVAIKDERVNLACEYFYYRNILFIIVTDVLRSVSWCERLFTVVCTSVDYHKNLCEYRTDYVCCASSDLNIRSDFSGKRFKKRTDLWRSFFLPKRRKSSLEIEKKVKHR